MYTLKVSYSDVGEGGVSVNCEKKHNFFLNTLYLVLLKLSLSNSFWVPMFPVFSSIAHSTRAVFFSFALVTLPESSSVLV